MIRLLPTVNFVPLDFEPEFIAHYDPNTNTININKKLKCSAKALMLIHEFTHWFVSFLMDLAEPSYLHKHENLYLAYLRLNAYADYAARHYVRLFVLLFYGHFGPISMKKTKIVQEYEAKK